jgi:hypothetical protein
MKKQQETLLTAIWHLLKVVGVTLTLPDTSAAVAASGEVVDVQVDVEVLVGQLHPHHARYSKS